VQADRREALDRTSAADWPDQNDAPPAGDLTRRLGSLPDGHPSSAYEADGTLRQPQVRLRDLDTGFDDDSERSADRTRPFTDAEWSDHLTDVRTRLDKAHAAGLATDRQFTTDPDREQWTAGRDRIQGDLVAELYERSSDVPCDRKAIMAGGLGGAGKSTVLGRYAGIDVSRYLTINPDNVKDEMASRSLIPDVEGLSPMEASDLVHEESSAIARQLSRRALSDGKNVIWDITMSSYASTERRIHELRSAGYSIDGIFVDVPVETSVRRAEGRHREGEDDYRANLGLGGRFVPPEVIRIQADPDWGSHNRRTFEGIKYLFDRWSRYDNSVDGRRPLLRETSTPDDEHRKE
jgi:predicted kinase